MASAKRVVYSCIADNRKIVYEAGDKGRHHDLVLNVLERCALDCRKSYKDEKSAFTVNYIAETERIWLCVAENGLNTRIAFGYLENVKRRSPHGGSRGVDQTIPVLLASQMSQFTSAQDKATQVNEAIEAVKEVMIENLAMVLRRGERLEDLQIRSEELKEDAQLFNKNATKLKSHFRWANLRWYLIGAIVLLIIAVAIAWGICGLTWQHCKKKTT